MALLPWLWERYYRDLERQTENIVAAADLLRSLATNFREVPATVRAIRALEHKGDALTRDLLTRMERLPLVHPRDELREVAHALDNVLDEIEAAAEAFDLYGVEQPTAAAIELIELCVRCAGQVAAVVAVLRESAWRGRRLAALRPHLEEINRLENLSDQVHREAMGALFRQSDVARMLKWKQVYDNLEAITDRCDDVGDAIQVAVLRHA